MVSEGVCNEIGAQSLIPNSMATASGVEFQLSNNFERRSYFVGREMEALRTFT